MAVLKAREYPVCFLIILLYLLPYDANCQIDTPFTDSKSDDLLEEYSIAGDETDLLNSIEYYRNNPLDLNSATFEDLMKLPFTDYRSADQIIRHRKRFGRYFSLNELYSVAQVDKSIIRNIIQFLFINDSAKLYPDSNISPIPNSQNNYSLTFRSRLINYYGSPSNKYDGSLIKQYNRLLFDYRNYKFGLITEKDAGESNFLDYSSFFISVKDEERNCTFLAGDFLLQFGQGLVMGGTYGGVKSIDINSVHLNDRNITPYTSVNENKALRGMTFNFRKGNYNISSFLSYNSFDAVMSDSAELISSILSDGNHRTQSELQNKDRGKELLYGGRFDLTSDSLYSFGILYCHSSLTPPLMLKDMTVQISKTDIYSLAYNISLQNAVFTGEIVARKDRISAITSLNLYLNNKIQFVVLYRNYSSSIMSIHSTSFDGNPLKQGTNTGIFTGVRLNTVLGEISMYYDQHKYLPALISDQPLSIDNELMIYFSKELNQKFEFGLKYKMRRNSTGPENLKSSRIEISYIPSKDIRFNSRFDFCFSSPNLTGPVEKGASFCQDLRMKAGEKLYFTTRLTLYNTSSYVTRMYEIERDLPGTTSSSVLFGRGIKLYFILQYAPSRTMNISLKYYQHDRNAAGNTANEESEFSLSEKSRLSIQVDLKI